MSHTTTEQTSCAGCDAPVTRVDGTDHTEADAKHSHPIAPGHAYEFIDDRDAVGRLCLRCANAFGAGTIAYVQRDGNAVATATIDGNVVYWGDERAINAASDAIRAVARRVDWTSSDDADRGHDDLPGAFQSDPTLAWTKTLCGVHHALADSEQARRLSAILAGDRALESDAVIVQTRTDAVTDIAIYTHRGNEADIATHFDDTAAEPAHAGIR